MNPSDKDLIKAVSEGLSKGTADALLTPFTLLVNRFCSEVGEAAGYVGTLTRIAVGIKVMKWAEAMLKQIGVDARPMARKLFFPMLESASLEDDEDLQARWAAMMANSANPNSETQVLPSFAHILKQLNRDDLAFIEALSDANADSATMRIVFDSKMAARDSREGMLVVLQRAGLAEYKGDYRSVSRDDRNTSAVEIETDESTLSLILDNVVRLGILERQEYPKLIFTHADYIHGPAKDEVSDVEAEQSYSLTNLGKLFVTVCRPPKQQ